MFFSPSPQKDNPLGYFYLKREKTKQMNKFFFIVLTMVVKMRPIGKTELKKTISRTSLHIMSCELSGFNLQPQLYSSPLYLNQPLWLFFFRGKMDLEIRLIWFKSIRLNHRNFGLYVPKTVKKWQFHGGRPNIIFSVLNLRVIVRTMDDVF